MNSRQRRKIEAIQHNDAIRYNDWLIKNTMNQTRKEEAKIYQRARQRIASRALILGAISSLGLSASSAGAL